MPRLLTVHLVTRRVEAELRDRLPSNDRYYYRRQRSHAVLIAVPHESASAAAARLHLVRMPPSNSTSDGEYALHVGGTTRFHVLSVDASLPAAMRANGRATPVATCAGAVWTRDYCLYSGAWFAYHLLRLPLIRRYEYYVSRLAAAVQQACNVDASP